MRSSAGRTHRQGKSQESKEAWLASHIFGIDHDDPWGRHHGLNGLGPAVPAFGRCRRGGAAASASASESAPRRLRDGSGRPGGSKADPIFGMAATRGARYLLRNGMDYLSYQEYERALKYFREAETRQKELNEAERLSLKQGIERPSAGSARPSAAKHPTRSANDRSRAGGFAAAKPRLANRRCQLAVGSTPTGCPPRRESPLARETIRASQYALRGPRNRKHVDGSIGSRRQPRADSRRDAEAITRGIRPTRSTSRDPQAAASLGDSRLPGDRRADQPWCNRRGGPPGAARWQRRPAESGRDPGPDWPGVRRASQAA